MMNFVFFRFSAQLLDAERILPLVVTISGRVCSETPVNCEFSRLRGVIVEETVHIYRFKEHNVHIFFRRKLNYFFLFVLYVTIVLISFSGRTTFFETQ